MGAEPGASRRRQHALFLLKCGVSLGLLAYLATLIPFDSFRDSLARVSLGWVALSVAVMAVTYYLNALQMFFMTERLALGVSTWRILAINFISRFYELFLPSYIASGAIRWYHLSRARGRPAEALAFMVLNRVLETVLLLAFGLVFWLLDQRAADASGRLPLVLGLLTGISVIAWGLTFHRGCHRLMERLLTALPLPSGLINRALKVVRSLQAFDDAGWSFHVRVIVVALVRHLLTIVAMVLLAPALALSISFETLAWIRTVVTFATLLPLSISGFGVREATFVGLLAPYGISAADALALSLLMFARGLVFSLIGGLLEAHRVLVVGKRSDTHD